MAQQGHPSVGHGQRVRKRGIGSGVPFLFAGDREAAQRATVRLLYTAARRRYRELRGLLLPANSRPKAEAGAA